MKTILFPLFSAACLLATTPAIHGADCCAVTATNRSSACCSSTDAAAAFTEKSIYQVESRWTTDKMKQIRLGQLAGRPQVLVMFFASCQYACPILVSDLKRIEAAFPPDVRARVGFTLVTFDVERDTPAVLAQYREARHLPDSTWTLLHGEPDDVLELAALLGVKYKKDARGQFAHSNVITVLNARGEIVHQQIGLGRDENETVAVLKKLAGK